MSFRFGIERYPGKFGQVSHFSHSIKVNGPFVQTLCIEKDSYMDAILRVSIFR